MSFNYIKKNKLPPPNEFTLEMGNLIKDAREEIGYSQKDLANLISRSQVTVSDIENGKTEITVMTLILFATILQKPLGYFIPPLFYNQIIKDKFSPTEIEMQQVMNNIEHHDRKVLALKLVKNILEYDEYARNPDNQYDHYEGKGFGDE